jgi:predicted amidohydrolase YtcJ
MHAIPPPAHGQLVRASEAALKECHRWGLTAIGDPGNGQNVIAAYEELARNARYTLRNHVLLAGTDGALVDAYLARGPRTLEYGGRLSFRAIKLYVDGALGSRGAALLAPYSDDPSNTGLLRTAQADVQHLCERALAAGFQVCTHAIGDRGNRVALDAYDAALRTAAVRDHRFRIEHAQVLAAEDVPRFARLGVIPSMQSTHQISDMAWAQTRLGPDRVRGAYAWRALLDTGVTIANGTDAPVEAVNSLRTFHAAITREDEANQPPGGWYPTQRMTRAEALKSMTIWAARANFMEHAAGSITVGKYADFAVLDRDWLRVAPEAIMATRVLATYSSGKPVYATPMNGKTTALRARGRRIGTCCGPPTG